MGQESTSPSTDKVLWGFPIDDIITAINDMDEGDNDNEDQAAAEENPTPDPTLLKLCTDIRSGIEAMLESMKQSLKPAEVEIYLRLNDALLSFQHWSDDITVNQENALDAIEQDQSNTEFKLFVENLRIDFDEIIGLIARFETTEDYVAEFELAVDHLKHFVDPLRTFLEAKHNVGKVAVVREKVAAYEASKASSSLEAPPSAKKKLKSKKSPAPKRRLLRNVIHNYFVNSLFDGNPREFAPAGAIDSLIVPDAVKLELDIKHPTEEDQDLVHYIVKEAKILFATTILVGITDKRLYDAMMLFKKSGINDDQSLPIIPKQKSPKEQDEDEDDDEEDNDGDGDEAEDQEPVLSDEESDDEIEDSKLTRIDPEQLIWELGRRKIFYERQWTFLAPVFSTREINYDLLPKDILPFMSRDSEIKSGAFGYVFKVAIHPKHLEDPDNMLGGPLTYLAVKKIVPHPEDQEQQNVVRNWTKEVGNLRRVTELKHDHIVRFITAFRREDAGSLAHYLLCEWADGGNLREFWDSISQPEPTESLIKEATTQLWGLSQALCAAHYPGDGKTYIRHGDLKPENILRFTGNGIIGTLKVGDWGLAKPKDNPTVFQMLKTSTGHGSVQYEAPEVRTGLRTKYGPAQNVRSRLYDVWAMGCIMLEFIIWLLEGVRGLDKFHKALTTRQNNAPYYVLRPVLGRDEAVLHSAVTNVMTDLEKRPSCKEGTALYDLLSLVRDRLLVVQLPKTLGQQENEQELVLAAMGRANTVDTRASPRLEAGGGEENQGFSSLPADMVMSGPDLLTAPESAAGISIQVTDHNDDQGDDIPAPSRVPEEEVEKNVPTRALATELRDALSKIIGKKEDSNYWLTETSKTGLKMVHRERAVPITSEYSSTTDSSRSTRYTSTSTTFTDSPDGSGPSTNPSSLGSKGTDFLGVDKQQDVGIRPTS